MGIKFPSFPQAQLNKVNLRADDLGLNGLPGCDSNPSTSIKAAFGAPVTEGDLEKLKEADAPKKTRKQTSWSASRWNEWVEYRNSTASTTGESVPTPLLNMSDEQLAYWIP